MSIISDLFLILGAMGMMRHFCELLQREEGGGAGLGNSCVYYIIGSILLGYSFFFW